MFQIIKKVNFARIERIWSPTIAINHYIFEKGFLKGVEWLENTIK
jgi:hypothetical protein